MQKSIIRAEIFGSDTATAEGLSVTSGAPVLKLCRALLEAGHDSSTPLEAYRGETLCLRVRSIGEGAKLTVQPNMTGRPVFVAYRASGIASPVRQNAREAA
jgi:hypothetical protein